MNRFSSFCRTAVAIVALVILGATFPALAGDEVPFKGLANVVITGVEPVGDDLHLTVDGTGQATHLGQFTRHEEVVLHADGTVEGSIVFFAANDDRLFVSVAGGFTSANTTAGTYTITGGTGRFTDATGSASWAGVTSDGSHFAITFEGTIGY